MSCPIVWNVSYSRGAKGIEVTIQTMFCLERFQMIANGVSKPLSFSVQLSIAEFSLLIQKNRALSRMCCFTLRTK